LGGGINTYGYVGGNPLSYVDPNGHGAKAGGVCATVASIYNYYQYKDELEKIEEQLENINKLLKKVYEEYKGCHDLNKRIELSNIERDLLMQQNNVVNREGQLRALMSLQGLAEDSIAVGICGIISEIPGL
jgi:hypothetical protein